MRKQLFRVKPIDQLRADDDPHGNVGEGIKLHRSLGVWDLTSLGIAAIIGAGIFSTIGNAAFDGGPAVVFLFVFTAIACAFSALCYAEFASMVPMAGSAYTYAYTSFGELVAWIIGWDLIMEYAIGNIAVAISWSDYFCSLLAGYGVHVPGYFTMDMLSAHRSFEKVGTFLAQGGTLARAATEISSASVAGYEAWSTAPRIFGIPVVCNLPALLITVVITAIVYIGIRESKRASNAMVGLKLCIIAAVIVIGAFYVRPENWIPFAPNGVSGVLKGVSAVFFAYIGFDAISTTAEECKNPQRDLPRGMIYSLVICTVLYILISLVLTGMISYKELQVGDPLSFVFGPKGANIPWIASVVAISAVIAMAGVLLVFQLGQPRIWMSMSRDGLLPPIFSAVHPRFQTPWFSTLVTGAVVAIPSLFLNLTEVTDLTSIGTLFAFILVCGGILMLEHHQPHLKRSFKVPYVNGQWIIPSLSAIAVVLLLVFNPSGVADYFKFQGFEKFLSHLPMWAYLVGMVCLNWLCMKHRLSLIPSLGLASCGYLMTELGVLNWMRFGLWLVVGLTVYFGYGFKRSHLNKAATA
ncbi:amino acid permease [Bdellovibrionota bacterium FG-1]